MNLYVTEGNHGLTLEREMKKEIHFFFAFSIFILYSQ